MLAAHVANALLTNVLFIPYGARFLPQNQDPTNPADPTQFMTEIAQMTAVQSQTSLAAEEQTVAAASAIWCVKTLLRECK